MRHAATIAGAALACASAVASEAACRDPEPSSAGGAGSVAPNAGGRGTIVDTKARVIGKLAEGEELLALAGDRLLLWTAQGRARSRSVDGTWTDLPLPLVGVREVHAKASAIGSDIVLLGQDPTNQTQAVSWVSIAGKEIARWALPKDAGFGAALDAAQMQITIGSTVSALEPGGILRPLRSLPEDRHRSAFGGTRWFELAGSIVCHGADLSMASNAPGHCRSLGAAAWEFEGPFVAPPLACGSWLIVSSSADGKALEVRDQSAGQPQGRATLSTPPLLACSGPAEVVLGTQELALRRLPSLDVIWRQPVEKGAIRQLAVMDNYVAYVVSDSWDVQLVPKPAAAPR